MVLSASDYDRPRKKVLEVGTLNEINEKNFMLEVRSMAIGNFELADTCRACLVCRNFDLVESISVFYTKCSLLSSVVSHAKCCLELFRKKKNGSKWNGRLLESCIIYASNDGSTCNYWQHLLVGSSKIAFVCFILEPSIIVRRRMKN